MMKKNDVIEVLLYALGGALVWFIIGIVFDISSEI